MQDKMVFLSKTSISPIDIVGNVCYNTNNRNWYTNRKKGEHRHEEASFLCQHDDGDVHADWLYAQNLLRAYVRYLLRVRKTLCRIRCGVTLLETGRLYRVFRFYYL